LVMNSGMTSAMLIFSETLDGIAGATRGQQESASNSVSLRCLMLHKIA
jgi:hypothetical protein